MPVGEFSLDLDPKGKLHGRLLDALNARFRLSAQRMTRLHDKWRKAEEQFIAYLPEKSADALRRTKRENEGAPQYTTIVLPYTYAMLMAAHSYWTTVFLSRNPILQFTGRHGESQQATQAVEALMDYQVQVGEMLIPFYFWLLDAGKYGLGIVGNYWDNEVSTISRYVEVPKTILGMPIGGVERQMVTEDVRGYSGNKIFNIRPYDYYPDPRVPFHAVQRCEFVGYRSEVGWHEIARRGNSGQFVNTKLLKKQEYGGRSTGREQGSPQVELPNDESALTTEDLSDTGPYGLVTIHVDLVPREWGVGEGTSSEKWVFTAAVKGGNVTEGQTSSLTLINEARPLGCYHSKHPFGIIEMEPEPYALASRSLPEVIRPIQQTMDWLLNSHFYNVRKTLNNQFLLDPSRIVMADFENPMAGGGIRAKPAAYGTDLRQAVSQFTVVDVTRGHLSDMTFMHEFAQRALGINDQIMGLLNTGGRKTAQEVRTSSTFGVNRQKTISEFFSAMGWAPLAQMFLQNSQQYYDVTQKFRIVGDLVQEAGQAFMNVSPENIRGAFDFVPVDGTLPVDRYAQANLWREILVGLRNLPEVGAKYDIARIFAWVAQLAGLKNITQFKVQLGDPAALALAAQRGNLIPLPGNRGPRDNTRVPEPGQVSGMGATG